jgi:Tol biopolymer transport system component/predicted Ser/Thr protein kinase
MVGHTLGHFRITALLGSGGMGIVYRAHDQKLERTVAIKLVGRETGATAEDRARIVVEARASSALSHPNICTVYETGEIEGHAYIAMEYVEGRPLSELIPVNGLPSEAVVRYGAQIADALEHAHARGVVHRDLKTPNVVVSAEGRAKVLDFGLARRVPSSVNEAVTNSSDAVPIGGLAGTMPYMPPELLLGQPTDERSDIWSFGVMLFEMAMGELPFKGRTEFELTAAILRSPPQPLPAHVPAMIRSVIQRCLSKDPAHRYQRAGEARAALEAIQSDITIPRPPGPAAVPVIRLRWIGAAVAAIAITIAAVVWFQKSRGPASRGAPATGRLTLAVGSSDAPIFDPAISADGKMLSYAAEDPDGQIDLFVRRVAGGALVKLTNDAARESSPRFSPDGERILFTRRESAGGVPELRIVPALGGDAIASVPAAAGGVWSADGQQLAFLRTTAGGTALTIASADGSHGRAVLGSDSSYPFLREPAWAPDGRDLAIVRGTGGIAGEIWLVPASGGAPRRPFSDPPDVFSDSPVFTADGRSLIHSSNRGGATNLWSSPAVGGPPVRLTTGPGPDTGPTVAGDGTIAFINSRWRNTLEIYGLAGDPSRTLTTHSPFLWAPTFSPDGQEIAFSRSEVDGSWHVWTMPAAGGAPRRLTSSAAGEVYPRYSPDGRFVWFHTWQTPRRIGRVPREGGSVELLTFGGSDAFPALSPDGTQIVVTRTDADAERLYLAPSEGGTARRLTATPGAVAQWSPDGKRIVFAGNRGHAAGIVLFDVAAGREQRLTATGGWPAWLPNGLEVAYLVIGRTGNQEIHVVPARGGAPRQLGQWPFNGSNHPFAVAPDGRSLVTSNSRHVSDEVWLLEPSARD